MSLRFELCDLVWQVQWKYKKYNQSTFNYVLNNYVDVNELNMFNYVSWCRWVTFSWIEKAK